MSSEPRIQTGVDLEQAAFPATLMLVQELLSFHAQRDPNAVFVEDDEGETSYGETEQLTNRLAQLLFTNGLARGDRAAFLMSKSRRSFQALFGILKADAIYVPVDSLAPVDRVRATIQDCGCRMVLTDAEALPKAIAATDKLGFRVKIVVLGTRDIGMVTSSSENADVIDTSKIESISSTPRKYCNIGFDPAYIIYTSGSTGNPKGVLIRHASILDYAQWTVRHFQVRPGDRLSSHAELHFDLSVFDLYTALAAGASLHLVPRSASLFPANFVSYVEKRRISIWCSVPSFLSYVANAGVLRAGRMPSLRAVTFCGEVMPTKTVASWMEAFPGVRFVNQYGPTETTCASMYHDVVARPDDLAVPLPIGRAIPNTEVFAIDEFGQRVVEPGSIGQLYIRGIGNSVGYWNDPDRTNAVFVPNPLVSGFPDSVYATGDLVRLRDDGAFDFVGRKDSQVKIMGYRIELGEVESALGSVDGVANAAVIAVEDQAVGGLTLAAFVVAAQHDSVSIRQRLSEKLPRHMIPKRIEVVESLPVNANGKVDRLLLTCRAAGKVEL